MPGEFEIGTYKEFVEDYRSVLKLVTDPEEIYEITAYREDKRYVVFAVSRWDEEIDGDKIAVHVTSRQLKDSPAFILNACRDQMFNLCVDVRGKPKYIIEPRVSGCRWVAARLGLDRKAWRSAVLGGRIHMALQVGNPADLENEVDGLQDEVEDAVRIARRQRRRLARAKAAQDALSADNTLLQHRLAEEAQAKAALGRPLGELSAAKDRCTVLANQNAALEARINQLNKALMEAGKPLPPWKEPGPWNP